MQTTLFQIQQATRALAGGQVIAYPTEAVWGLGCDPTNHLAVEKILRLKQRPWQKGLIVIAANWQQLQPYCLTPTTAEYAALQASWPGPNTWLIPAHPDTPEWLTGTHQTLAVRVSNHPTVQQLCKRYGQAIVSTSANPAGLQPAKQAWRCKQYFGANIHIVPGSVGNSRQPSTIRDLATRQIVRA